MFMSGQALLCAPPSLNLRRASPATAGRKHAERLLSSLRSISAPDAIDRRVRKFLTSTPKTAAITTLSLLLSENPPSFLFLQVAISLYRNIKASPWYAWNANLAAGVIPLLDEIEAKAAILEAQSVLKPRDLSLFFSDLIESYARRGMRERVFEIFSLFMSPGKFSEESLLKALCILDSPSEAEEILKRIKTSAFHYRLVIQSFGKLGLFEDMNRVFESMISSGIAADTVSFNVILSCYGERGMLEEMESWVNRMRDSGIPYSIRTCNSILNSCPHLISILQDERTLPTTLEKLLHRLEEKETRLVREMASSRAIMESSGWDSSEGKMDLHGYHASSAFVALLVWVDELERRFREGETSIPRDICIVCGRGKHSDEMGESRVKKLVRAALFLMESPFRVDRKNVGRLVGGGTAVREWLLTREGS